MGGGRTPRDGSGKLAILGARLTRKAVGRRVTMMIVWTRVVCAALFGSQLTSMNTV